MGLWRDYSKEDEILLSKRINKDQNFSNLNEIKKSGDKYENYSTNNSNNNYDNLSNKKNTNVSKYKIESKTFFFLNASKLNFI